MKHRCLERAAECAEMLASRKWHDPHDPRSNLVDALTNLRHYAASQRLDFDSALRMSHEHQRAEREQDIADEPEPGAIDPAAIKTALRWRYAVIDSQGGATVTTRQTLSGARRIADSMDLSYGAIRYRVQRVAVP